VDGTVLISVVKSAVIIMVEGAVMSIINKMHEDFQQIQQAQPILSAMPVTKSKQKALLFILIVLLIGSSLGLSYLIFSQDKAVKENLHQIIKEQQIAPPVAAALLSSSVQEKVITAPKLLSSSVQEKVITAPKLLSSPMQDKVIAEPLLVKQAVEQSSKTNLPNKLAVVNPASIKKEAQKAVLVQTSDKKIGVKNTTSVITEQANEESHLSIKASQLSKQELAQIHLKEADKAQDKGDFKLAAEKKQQALGLLPELNEVRKSLALYYYGQGEVDRAQRLLKHGVVISPDYPDFNLMLSRIALKEGDQQKAYLYLEQHPPEVEGNLDYYASYAILAQKFKKYEQSERLYSSLLSQRPNNGRWRMSLAIVQDRQAKRQLAVTNYEQALLQTDLSSKAKTYIKQRLSYLGQH
jgi:MSHA biogenesis protein MshN